MTKRKNKKRTNLRLSFSSLDFSFSSLHLSNCSFNSFNREEMHLLLDFSSPTVFLSFLFSSLSSSSLRFSSSFNVLNKRIPMKSGFVEMMGWNTLFLTSDSIGVLVSRKLVDPRHWNAAHSMDLMASITFNQPIEVCSVSMYLQWHTPERICSCDILLCCECKDRRLLRRT